MADIPVHDLHLSSIGREAVLCFASGVVLLIWATRISNIETSASQRQALLIGLAGAGLSWLYLLKVTDVQWKEVGTYQFAGLAFSLLIALMAWLRFVLTSSGSIRRG